MESEEKLEEFISNNDFAVIFFGDEASQHFKEYLKATKIFEHISFAHVQILIKQKENLLF